MQAKYFNNRALDGAHGTGVDNALVEIDQEEVPIMDGSSKVFVNYKNSI